MTNDKQTCDCGCMGAGPALTGLLGRLGPAKAREHFRSARVEMLKGMRALLDARIERLSRSQTAGAGTTVPVE